MSDEHESTGEKKSIYLMMRETDLKVSEEDMTRQLSYLNDLRTNPRYVEFFSKYHEYSVGQFIDSYAHLKTEYTRNAGPSEDDSENAKMGLTRDALGGLCEIQQKKIFNVQCLWRAEQIQVEGVLSCSDFIYWQSYPLACPFIDPISREEVKAYLEYLQTPCIGLREHWSSNYQFYDRFKSSIQEQKELEEEKYEDDEEEWDKPVNGEEEEYEEDEYDELEEDELDEDRYPDWYAFYDKKFGTGHLIQLHDVRGDKESYYFNLSVTHQQRTLKKEGRDPVVEMMNRKPYLVSYDEDTINYFVETFEGLEEKENWKNYRDARRKKDPEVEEALEILLCTPDLIPMEANPDWRKAIIRAGQVCKNLLVAKAIPFAYEEYRMKLSAGIAFYDHLGEGGIEAYRDLATRDIMNGRELSGEPRDFNF